MPSVAEGLKIACQVVNPSKQDEQDEGPQLLGLNYIMIQSLLTITIKCCKNCVPRSRTKVHGNSLKYHHAVQLEVPRITAMQLSHIWTVKESPQMLHVHAG
jgi:hypothetical protein